MESLHESIYDHPKCYDLVFGADCAAEMKFIRQVNAKFMDGKAQRLFEPACGTGRLMAGLAKQGFEIEGIDLNEKAVAFCNARLQRAGHSVRARVADMSDFKSRRKWDLAFNTINSFRHLTTEQNAVDHLRCMADGTRRGGIYLVGIHLTPTSNPPSDGESWSARRGHLSVTTQMWVVERAPLKRMERFGIQFDVYTPTRQFRIVDELRLRSYDVAQFEELLKVAGHWRIESTFDFGYEIDQPIEVDSSSEDVVYVLRRM